MRNKFIPLIVMTFLLFSSLAFALSSVGVVAPLSNQNLSGTITLNATTDAAAVNVTFRWMNSSGSFVLNTTIYNDTVSDTVFENTSFDTSLLTDGIYNLTVNATNSTGTVVGNNSVVLITIDNTEPTISSVSNTSITTTSAIVNWTTNEAANSSVNYGTTTALGTTSGNVTLNTAHSISLSGLSDDTTYYYNVTSCDSFGNCNTTGPYDFTTLDGTEPSISSVVNYSITTTSAIVNWTTNEAANSSANYGTTTALGTTSGNVTLATGHSIRLTSLSESTTYYYNVTSCDSSDNCNTTGPYSFTTLDGTEPTIISVVNYSITISSAIVNWTTNEAANSSANYGTTTALGTTSGNATLATAHSISLTSLSDDTTYYYNVTSCDSSDNCNTTGPYSFTTLDGTAPGIENVTNTSITASAATITWDTTENANSSVNYGTTTALGTTSTNSTLATAHSISLTSLSASTVYYYNVTSCDSSDNCNTTGNYNFTTSAAADDDDDDSGSSGSGSATTTQQASSYFKNVWYVIDAGETVSMESDNEEIGITKIEFEVSEETYGGWMKVKALDEAPTFIDSLDQTTYKNLDITKGLALEDDIMSDITIKFQVLKSWLSENGVDKSSVVLYRYNYGWVELETTTVEEDDDYVYYTAETPGFSYFAIAQGTERVGEETTEETSEDETIIEGGSVERVSDLEEGFEINVLDSEETGDKITGNVVAEGTEGSRWGIILLISVLVILGIGGWLLYAKKNKQWPYNKRKKGKPKVTFNF